MRSWAIPVVVARVAAVYAHTKFYRLYCQYSGMLFADTSDGRLQIRYRQKVTMVVHLTGKKAGTKAESSVKNLLDAS